MKKTLIALIVVNAFAVTNANAAADTNTWYGGAKLGWSHYFDANGGNNSNGNLNNATEFDTSNDSVGGGVFGGYQILPWLAVEGGYDYLGNMQAQGNNGVSGTKMGAQGLQLSMKASYAFNDRWDVYGRAGAMAYRAETQQDDQSKFETGLRPLAAVGTEYEFNDNWAGRVEYQWVSNVGNTNQIGMSADSSTVTAGVVYRFGQNAAAPVAAEPAPAEVPVEPQRFNLKSDVMFGFNSATLSPEGEAAVRDLYNRPEIQAAKEKTTMVIGFSDRLGSANYNLELSTQRAQAVADELVRLGMPAQNVQAEGRGSSEPVTGATCDAVQERNELINCLAPDRRVVVEIAGVAVQP
ncbi:outer membrane protein A [Buttiauxella brennerae ATCC 51605]|jgi:OOP family OmpA-OmpF porin|uniref:Outer membrane protein A n=1 Tax=Buttiauxella brennerae ATCC 51605 TaxID=1354251 RepID=A0A1B7IE69_9ENTR|nr:porin OmpA [Buttiauxella brennerae]OAT27605.1 outer membrane protein A [Buttiauxella brennerae ATCC 51605]